MSKKFKCPVCLNTGYATARLHDGTDVRRCSEPKCYVQWLPINDSKYLTDVSDEPPRPTDDELMRVAPGWDVDRYDYPTEDDRCVFYDINGNLCLSVRISGGLDKYWILRKRPDWAYYQRENAEKWLAENRPDLKIVGLKKVDERDSTSLFISIKCISVFHEVCHADGCAYDVWRWVVEPKESVKELPISYKHRVAACVMIDGNPMTLQKVACYYWERFAGFLYADGSIEADFKRIRNGQVEWATGVRVKQ